MQLVLKGALVAGLWGILIVDVNIVSAEEAAPRPSQNSIGLNLVLIPAGDFVMGSPDDESGRKPDEQQHHVTLARPFYMSACEITQDQYEEVMGHNPAQAKGSDHPVERVSWFDATEFCRRLSQRENAVYRLPTEAEWEYAARAGNSDAWCGYRDATRLGEHAWIATNSGGKGACAVGQKLPNEFGLYDMLGNVAEWCADWLGPYEGDEVVDPQGPVEGAFRVIRGGSGSNNPNYCRAAIRVFSAEPTHTSNWCGFRVVRER